MKAILAAGGSGKRMLPSTRFINKHLITVGFGELMIDQPLKFLKKQGFKEITIVTGSNHASQICEYVQDGERYGFQQVDYYFQPKPDGIAGILKRIPNTEDVFLILGDNYFSHPIPYLYPNFEFVNAVCFEFDLKDQTKAQSFGQIVYDSYDKPIDLIEKPNHPTHSKIITGLYYFPKDVFEVVKNLKPSHRGELEITDLLKYYLKKNRLSVREVQGDWIDLGEQDSWSRFILKRIQEK